MNDEIKRLSEARQKAGWTQEEIEAFAKRRRRELEDISKQAIEPGYLASGTQKSLDEIFQDEESDDKTGKRDR